MRFFRRTFHRASAPQSRPVIIIGAARSGTKLLRALISSHESFVAIPYDINFVWKYGNYSHPDDDLDPTQLTPRARAFIREYFSRAVAGGPNARVVEKTVSNTMRVRYVREVFPDCQLVHLVRDGRDVAASAMRMWRAPADWRRVLKKVPRFPLEAVPVYGLAYVQSYLGRLVRDDSTVGSWGPRFRGIDGEVRRRPLLDVCGMQWRHSVERATDDLASIPAKDKIDVRYEELVRRPVDEMERIFRFLGSSMPRSVERQVAELVTTTNVGKWKKQLTEGEVATLMSVIGDTLERVGYSAGGGSDAV